MTVVISRFISYSIFIPKKWIIIFLKFRFYFSKVFFFFFVHSNCYSFAEVRCRSSYLLAKLESKTCEALESWKNYTKLETCYHHVCVSVRVWWNGMSLCLVVDDDRWRHTMIEPIESFRSKPNGHSIERESMKWIKDEKMSRRWGGRDLWRDSLLFNSFNWKCFLLGFFFRLVVGDYFRDFRVSSGWDTGHTEGGKVETKRQTELCTCAPSSVHHRRGHGYVGHKFFPQFFNRNKFKRRHSFC